ncbi:MAG: hypothetical protein CLLPBCKN_007752 [Chroococcidiopsis cubana SAG 39.79]|jgi:hypothetical protein|uniref:Uncharacterized protein n=1 Tax=Chroococcidiopsis cubana SAG 39.79 TaxID=388085 RepID=A0AB37USE3_9CYAN|nr:hypothetical protein [Chroococcidiopsis cubana SAG 39.79]RUT14318.1 hypothetical protein DSM107010_03490 [Chroococcidiopsis cubana SAG 39.79]
MYDLSIAPFLRGLGDLQNKLPHRKIPPSPPYERGEQKVAHGVTLHVTSLQTNLTPIAQAEKL